MVSMKVLFLFVNIHLIQHAMHYNYVSFHALLVQKNTPAGGGQDDGYSVNSSPLIFWEQNQFCR